MKFMICNNNYRNYQLTISEDGQTDTLGYIMIELNMIHLHKVLYGGKYLNYKHFISYIRMFKVIIN